MRQTENRVSPPFSRTAPLFRPHTRRPAPASTGALPPSESTPGTNTIHDHWLTSSDRSAPVGRKSPPPTTQTGGGHRHRGGRAAADGATELVLYISGNSLNSTRAIRSLTTLLERYPAGQFRARIVDVADDVEGATRDRVLFTPTLIVTDRSLRTTRLLGSLANAEVLAELLNALGVERA